MSERAKLGLLCFLFLLALGIGVLMIMDAIQAAHDLQQQNNALKAEDVKAIRPWMTVRVISRIYHIPEEYLDQALNLARTEPLRKVTLYEIASAKHRPVEQIIHTVQQAILTYRSGCPCTFTPFAPRQQLKRRGQASVPI